MVLFVWCSFAYYGVSSQVFYYTTLRCDSEFEVRFALAATVQKVAHRSTFLIAYGGQSHGGEPHLDMALHIVARLISFVMALHAN